MGVGQHGELTVCDIMGEWGAYQWSVTLFALTYSSIISITVVVGPMWTPDLEHVCASDVHMINRANVKFSTIGGQSKQQCYLTSDQQQQFAVSNLQQNATISNSLLEITDECTSFIYNDADYGQVLTNSFDLVCSRKFLRSLVSSSALIGMLLSSVTLGLLSDKYGRIKNAKVGMTIAILATVGAIFANNYFLLNVFIMLMSYGQVDVANAVSILVMEATSPKWRFASVFEYSFGWSLGMFLVPILNSLTKNYQHFLVIMLVWQLLMLFWFRWGVFESIRWLLSEGKINQAQIELQRACRINRVKNGADLAQKIANVQMMQVRKASSVIDEVTAPERLARATQKQVDDATQELNVLGAAIRRSFALESSPNVSLAPNVAELVSNNRDEPANVLEIPVAQSRVDIRPELPEHLSPTLTQKSFSVHNVGQGKNGSFNSRGNFFDPNDQQGKNQHRRSVEMMILGQVSPNSRNSITTQALIQLTLKYSKTLQEQEESNFFLFQMFHRKLYKLTIVGMMLSIVLETTYYGLVQATKFIGFSVNLNYIVGALFEALAACTYIVILWLIPRRVALIAPTLLSASACLGIALCYHFIPIKPGAGNGLQHQQSSSHCHHQFPEFRANITYLMDQVDSFVLSDNITGLGIIMPTPSSTHLNELLDDNNDNANSMSNLRERINFWLMNFGKISVNVAMQTSSTIVMEAYPNNLRQSGSGSILFIGRICSIMSPFLFNDNSEERTMFKLTLISIASISVLVCLMVPFLLRDTNKELSDRLNDIED